VSPIVIVLVAGLNLGLIFVLMALPMGVRTVSGSIRVAARRDKLWQALYPLGAEAGWSQEILYAERSKAMSRARLRLSWTGRDGTPIERDVALFDVSEPAGFTMRVIDDTSLDPSFWAEFSERVFVESADDGAIVRIEQRDRYRGAAFLVFRHFALRRKLAKLKVWAETGTYRSGGAFEHPFTQAGFAVLSVLILWPLFGLDGRGLALAAGLTVVVGLHELGHLAAFRVVGHTGVRMIFIPILGGIAIGGRPYDRRFEVGFVALMGTGFSAFLVPPAIAFGNSATGSGNTELALIFAAFTGFLALFNLGNLVPVWKFDGGQALRQIVPGAAGQACAAFVLVLAFLGVGALAGFSGTALFIAGAIFAVLSVMTASSGVKPRHELKPLDRLERAGLSAALVSIFVIHAAGLLWAAGTLFPNVAT
jgi:Zn-dependent protease